GPSAAVAALALDRQRSKQVAAGLGLKVPFGSVVDSTKVSDLEKTAFNIFRSMPHPLVVKPVTGGSSAGMTKVEHFDMLPGALERAFDVSPLALVEEYMSGTPATVGIIDNFRGEKSYALMPVEYGVGFERVPGNFSREAKNHLMTAARLAHQ